MKSFYRDFQGPVRDMQHLDRMTGISSQSCAISLENSLAVVGANESTSIHRLANTLLVRLSYILVCPAAALFTSLRCRGITADWILAHHCFRCDP